MEEYQGLHFTVKNIDSKTGLDHNAGGKALGLKRLINLDFRVPPAFVCIPKPNGDGTDGITDAYDDLGGGKVAVRSSSSAEDGTHAAAAGQYETVLNVEGLEALASAIDRCIASAESNRVKTYHLHQSGGENGSAMAVIVQRMIDPVKAGVVFSVDPVSGSREYVIIEAVSGGGEKLVGGSAAGELYTLDRRDGSLLRKPENPLLSETELHELREGALRAERAWDCPVDMEWAIDDEGTLHWLQARPVTTNGADSLDTPIGEGELVTRCNIGEMLPGAATPLTLSVFAEPLNWGMQEMYRREGVLKGVEPIPRFINKVSNHLFMNLSSMYIMARKVAGASREAIELNIIGRVLPPHEIGPNSSGLTRLINGIRYFGLVFGHNRFLRKIEQLGKTFRIATENRNAIELYTDLVREQERTLNKAFLYHYFVSSYSGAMNGILAAILSGGKEISREAHGTMSMLLTDIPEIESAALSRDLSVIADAVIENGRTDLITASGHEREAVAWLKSDESEEAGQLFTAFLRRHGHRCIREAELKSKDYESYPEELIPTLAEMIRAKRAGSGKTSADRKRPSTLSGGDPESDGKVPAWILKKAKEGVRQREYSKSMLILTQHQFKLGYRKLASMLHTAGTIPDPDLIYFFTKDEIGILVEAGRREDVRALVRRAEARRVEMPYQMELQFPEVSRGRPEPIEPHTIDGKEGDLIEGTPVSRGIAEGRVRIVSRLEDAYRLDPGDIMIAPFTDVGWTPFFGSIAGLVTEIGGALSHGAVVAREYGIPMVSNIPGITSVLKTGTRIRLDGRSGTIRIL